MYHDLTSESWLHFAHWWELGECYCACMPVHVGEGPGNGQRRFITGISVTHSPVLIYVTAGAEWVELVG